MLDDSSFSAKFHTNPFTVFRRMVVLSEKIICFQLVALFYLESIFAMHFGKRNGLDKGRLLHSSAVLSLTVAPFFVNLFAMSRAVTNVCCSAKETICSSCLRVLHPIELNRFNLLNIRANISPLCHFTFNCLC